MKRAEAIEIINRMIKDRQEIIRDEVMHKKVGSGSAKASREIQAFTTLLPSLRQEPK